MFGGGRDECKHCNRMNPNHQICSFLIIRCVPILFKAARRVKILVTCPNSPNVTPIMKNKFLVFIRGVLILRKFKIFLNHGEAMNKDFGFYEGRPFYIVSRMPMKRVAELSGSNILLKRIDFNRNRKQ